MPYSIGMSPRHDATLYTLRVVSSEITYDVQPPDPFYFRHSASEVLLELRV